MVAFMICIPSLACSIRASNLERGLQLDLQVEVSCMLQAAEG
jgi:hypothetical protein